MRPCLFEFRHHFAILLLSLLTIVPVQGQSDLAFLDSPPGDYIGGGQLYFTTNRNEVQIQGTPADFTVDAFGFSFWFAGPGGAPLAEGSYTNAIRTPFNGAQPGLSIYGNGRGCNTVAATFEILELVTTGDGITSLWVKFSHSCEGVMPAATGEIRINSSKAPAQPIPRTLRVPADYPSIQAAIAGAQLIGDTIAVDPGSYAGPITFGAKRIRLLATAGPAKTTITGPAGGAVVEISGGQDAASSLEGFTLRDGAGGVLVQGSSPTIFGNLITNCGYGINVQFASPSIVSNVITGANGSASSGLGNGSGIHLGGAAQALIERNQIVSNLAGITCFAAGNPVICNNLLRGNAGDGINLVNSSDADIIQNVIAGNLGAGISWLVPFGNRGPLVLQNTIADNGGAGIFADGFDGAAEIRNNEISGTPAINCGSFNDLNPPIIRTNNVYAPSGPAYAGSCPDLTGQNGNISLPPQFLEPEFGDYRPLATMPGIDLASPVPGLELDFAQLARVASGDGTSPAKPDLGAYEYQPGPPRPPTSLSALSVPEGVELSWRFFDGATRYELRRATDPSGSFAFVTVLITNRFTDTAAIAGVRYYYTIAGVNALGTGAASAPVGVRAGNRPPVAAPDVGYGDEDTPFNIPLLTNDSDPDGDTLSFSLLTTPPDVTLAVNTNGVVATPSMNWNGTNVFTYRVTDGNSGSSTGLVTIIVRPINDPPVLAPGFYQIPANRAAILSLQAADPEGDSLSAEVVAGGASGIVSAVPGAAQLVYEPAHGFSGRDVVAARVFDGHVYSEPATITIDVLPARDLDKDGMDDDWENLWDLNNPLADPDGDGVVNRDEFTALTSPRDAASYLAIDSIELTSQGFARLGWVSAGGVRYRVQASDDGGAFLDLKRPVAEEMDSAPVGQASLQAFLDTRPPPAGGVRL